MVKIKVEFEATENQIKFLKEYGLTPKRWGKTLLETMLEYQEARFYLKKDLPDDVRKKMVEEMAKKFGIE